MDKNNGEEYMIEQNNIVILGGYGLIGSEIARLIRIHHPSISICIAGRSAEKAASLQRSLGNTDFIQIDINNPESFQNFPARPSVIICAVNDTNDNILRKALSDGIPLVDITRWNEPLLKAIELIKSHKPKAPILFASSWMAGVSSILARHAMNGLENPVSVDIDILYAMKDKAGPNAIEFMDQFHKSFAVIENDNLKWIRPFMDSHMANFPGNRSYRTYRFGTPEQYTLPQIKGIQRAATRISFDSGFTTWVLAAVVQSGLWKLISGNRFNALRRSILHSSGNGGSAVLMVEAHNNSHKNTVTAIDHKGQSHLTAVGALIQIERILGLDHSPPPEGLTFPEESPVIEGAIKRMMACGVAIDSIRSGERDATSRNSKE
ncbi:MAG: saccharopine dehydrogenase [Desulfobacterium sp.]|nr:saccharopine dehydrogenase [Desulfobacterium sp.]